MYYYVKLYAKRKKKKKSTKARGGTESVSDNSVRLGPVHPMW